MGKRAGEPDELGDLRNIDRNTLLDPRMQREIERFVAEIQRAARRCIEFFRIDRNRAIDMRDAVLERQAHNGALQFGGRVALAKRIDGLCELVEHIIEIELGVDERRRPDTRDRCPVCAACPSVRRHAARSDVYVDRGRSSARLPRFAHGRENLRETEISAGDFCRKRRLGMRRVE